MDDLKLVIKEIAVLFFLKCSKYPREQLNREFIDDLYNETIHEFCMMNMINNKSNENKL